jgi:hypothetical protein
MDLKNSDSQAPPLQCATADVSKSLAVPKRLGARVSERQLQWIYPSLLIVVIAWVANYLHFNSFGFYEDDWYFCAPPFLLPSSTWFAHMLGGVRQFVVGRPLQIVSLYLGGYLGAVSSSIELMYMIAFALFAVSALLNYAVLRLRFPILFSTVASILFVLSPLITIKQFLNGEFSLGPAFICLFVAILLRSKGRVILAYISASLLLVLYEPIFCLFLMAPFFQKGKDRNRLRSVAVHFVACSSIFVIYIVVRHFLSEERLANLPEGPGRTLLNVFLYDAFFCISSLKTYVYALYVGLREISLEAVFYCGLLFIPAIVVLLRSPWTSYALQPFKKTSFSRARLVWWMQNGIGSGILLTALGYLFAYFHLYRDWTFPLSGRDTRASAGAVFGHTILLAAAIVLFLNAFRRPILRVVAHAIVIAGLSMLFCYSFVVQRDYTNAWKEQQSFLAQLIMLSPDVEPDSLFIVRGDWIEEPLFPKNSRRPSIGSQKHGLQVSVRSMFGWDTSPQILYVYTDDWKNYLSLKKGKLYWKQASFPGGWGVSTSEPITPGHIILLAERRNGTLARLDTQVQLENTPIIQIAPPVQGRPESKWAAMAASSLFPKVVPEVVSSAVMVTAADQPFAIVQPVTKGLSARMAVKFPAVETPAVVNLGDPLLTTGRPGAGDVISVRYYGHNTLRARIDHWGYPPVESEWMSYDPGTLYSIKMEMTDSISVMIGNSVHATVKMKAYPTAKSEVFFGKNPIGGGTTKEHFAGEISNTQAQIP